MKINNLMPILLLVFFEGKISAREYYLTNKNSENVLLILERARKEMNSEAFMKGTGIIDTVSTGCIGDTTFTTRIMSAINGSMRFKQTFSSDEIIAGIDSQWAWTYDSKTKKKQTVNLTMKTFLRHHEFHMMFLSPETRFSSPVFLLDSEMFMNEKSSVVKFLNELGLPVKFYYSTSSGLPLGMSHQDFTSKINSEIVVHVKDWKIIDDLLLFTSAEILHGKDVYQYEFTSINAMAQSVSLKNEE